MGSLTAAFLPHEPERYPDEGEGGHAFYRLIGNPDPEQLFLMRFKIGNGAAGRIFAKFAGVFFCVHDAA